MRKIILILTISAFFAVNSIGQNVGDSPQTKLGFTTRIHSEILNDSLNLFIHLPFNYKKDREFPLILLLDAHTSFKAFSASTELMAYDRSIPTCIVVAFPQYKYADFDSTNIEAKMDKLAKFIGEELLPRIESKYNITKKIIWGPRSEITTYLMLDKPDLFDGYIADAPNFGLISEKVNSKNAFAKLKDKHVNYYLFGSIKHNIYNERFLNNLKANAPKGLNWHYNISDEPNKIIYFINNYMHAIELFFNNVEE